MDFIIDRLAHLKAQISLSKSENLTDINIYSENFFRDFLNKVYNLNLDNANAETANYPSIDLQDKKSGLAIQVTSTSAKSKLVKTVNSFISNKLFEDFDKLKILILSEKKNYQTDKLGDPSLFQLDVKADVWDFGDIISEINDKKTSEIVEISKFLRNEIKLGTSPVKTDCFEQHAGELLSLRFRDTLIEVDENGLHYFHFQKPTFGEIFHFYAFPVNSETPLTTSDLIDLQSKYSLIPNKGVPNFLLLISKNGLDADTSTLLKKNSKWRSR